MKTDMMLGIQIQLAAAHWLENENLFICFDKSKRSNYNYANTPEVKAKLRRAAGESIAPHGVELVLKDGSVVAKRTFRLSFSGLKSPKFSRKSAAENVLYNGIRRKVLFYFI